MFKKSSRKILVTALTLLIGFGSTTLAAPISQGEKSQNPENQIEHKCPKKRVNKGMHFKKLASIKELGLTEEEIRAGDKANKTIFDLAKEKKGLTPDQVKSIIIKSRTEAINKKVSEGKITKEKAEEIIPKMKARIEKWDGSLKPHKHLPKTNQ